MNYKKQFKKGIHDLKKVSLSKSEKEGMLARLVEHTTENPLIISQSTGVFDSIYLKLKTYRSAYGFALAAVLLIVGGNISYAAEQALPGDFLYPVKIHVNEKVQDVLKVTPKASVKWEEKKIEKRLDEVNTLVEKGTFDAKKRKQVEKEVQRNVDSIRKQENKNENKKKDNSLENVVDNKLEKIHKTQEIKKLEIKQKHEVEQLEKKIQNEIKIKPGRQKSLL